MLVMAKKKPTSRKGKPLGVWIDTALRDAIEAARKRNRRTLREEVSLALEQYLERLGVWPPANPSQNGGQS